MGYLLMDHETANSIGGYRSEREALQAVLDAVDRYGADSGAVLSLSLARTHGDPGSAHIASGRALAERAMALRAQGAVGKSRGRAA